MRSELALWIFSQITVTNIVKANNSPDKVTYLYLNLSEEIPFCVYVKVSAPNEFNIRLDGNERKYSSMVIFIILLTYFSLPYTQVISDVF